MPDIIKLRFITIDESLQQYILPVIWALMYGRKSLKKSRPRMFLFIEKKVTFSNMHVIQRHSLLLYLLGIW